MDGTVFCELNVQDPFISVQNAGIAVYLFPFMDKETAIECIENLLPFSVSDLLIFLFCFFRRYLFFDMN